MTHIFKTFLFLFGILFTYEITYGEPRLQTCISVAPASCQLNEKSKFTTIYACMKGRTLNFAIPSEQQCAIELSHYETHLACDSKDIPEFCADVKPGSGRVMSCLEDHLEKLSKNCKSALQTYRDIKNNNSTVNNNSESDC